MTGGPSTEHTTGRVSLPCATWRSVPEHQRCRGTVLAGNMGPVVRCVCPCHRAATTREPRA